MERDVDLLLDESEEPPRRPGRVAPDDVEDEGLGIDEVEELVGQQRQRQADGEAGGLHHALPEVVALVEVELDEEHGHDEDDVEPDVDREPEQTAAVEPAVRRGAQREHRVRAEEHQRAEGEGLDERQPAELEAREGEHDDREDAPGLALREVPDLPIEDEAERDGGQRRQEPRAVPGVADDELHPGAVDVRRQEHLRPVEVVEEHLAFHDEARVEEVGALVTVDEAELRHRHEDYGHQKDEDHADNPRASLVDSRDHRDDTSTIIAVAPFDAAMSGTTTVVQAIRQAHPGRDARQVPVT